MLGLFKKDAKVDPQELEKLRQKLSEVTSQPVPVQPPSQPAASLVPQSLPAQSPQSSQQYTYVDPARAEENEKITNLIMQQIKELIEIDSNLNTKIKEIETKLSDNTNAVNNMKSSFDSHKIKMEVIDKNMEKFMGLYEIVTNRFNPFIVEDDEVPKPAVQDTQAVTQAVRPPVPSGASPESKAESAPMVLDRLSTEAAPIERQPDMNDHMAQLAAEVTRAVNSEMRQAISGLHSSIGNMVDSAVKEQVERGAAIKNLVRNTVAEELGKSGDPEPKRQKKVAKTYQFHLPNGFPVDSRQSLIDGLKSISDAEFSKYVDASKNDFAQWIALALKEEEMARQALKIKDRQELISFCESML